MNEKKHKEKREGKRDGKKRTIGWAATWWRGMARRRSTAVVGKVTVAGGEET